MSLISDIKDFVTSVWEDVMEFFTDLPKLILEGFLEAVAYVIESIPAPDFMATPISSHIPDVLTWFLVQSGFGACLLVIAGGIVFYFMRRLLTLGIW